MTHETKPVAWWFEAHNSAYVFYPHEKERALQCARLRNVELSPLYSSEAYEAVKRERDEARTKLFELVAEDAIPTSAFEICEARAEAAERERDEAQAEVDRLRALLDEAVKAKPAPQQHVGGPQPCGIADPSTRDCQNMKEVGGGMDGERYRCDVCGEGYFLDYEEMK